MIPSYKMALDQAKKDDDKIEYMPLEMYHIARHGVLGLGMAETIPFIGYDVGLSLLSYKNDGEPAVTVWLSTWGQWEGVRLVNINADTARPINLKIVGTFVTMRQEGKDHLPWQTVYVYKEKENE